MTPLELAQIDAAIAAHGKWLTRLRTAIYEGSSEFTPAVVRADDKCDFGRWLYGAFPASLRGSPVFEDIRQTHARFHVQAAMVLELATGGRRDDAANLMAPGSDFMSLSGWLLLKLRRLRDSGGA